VFYEYPAYVDADVGVGTGVENARQKKWQPIRLP